MALYIIGFLGLLGIAFLVVLTVYIVKKNREGKGNPYVGKEKAPSVSKIIGLALVAIIAIGLIIISVGLIGEHFGSISDYSTVESIALDRNETNEEIYKWMEKCDEKGEGIYVLKATNEEKDKKVTKLLTYRNDGFYGMVITPISGNVFHRPQVQFSYFDDENPMNLGYSLNYCEISAKFYGNPNFVDLGNEGHELGYDLTETPDFEFDYEGCWNSVNVNVDENITNVACISIGYYDADGDLVESDVCQDADTGSPIDYGGFEQKKKGYEAFTLTFTGENNEILYESEVYSMAKYKDWNFQLALDKNDKLTLKKL